METTLVLLKPDCMQKKHAGEVIGRFESAGLDIIGCKMMQLTSEILREHYSHIADKPFFPEVEGFMSSGPVIALALRGEGVIAKIRELAGPTNSKEAPKGSIRGDIGEDVMHNIVHASDGPEAAAEELNRFFDTCEIFA
jgi:nucleoside-diphosphate kinase